MLKLIGGLLFLFGLGDLVAGLADRDLWMDYIGVELPDPFGKFSAWIEIALGALLFKLGGKRRED